MPCLVRRNKNVQLHPLPVNVPGRKRGAGRRVAKRGEGGGYTGHPRGWLRVPYFAD